MSHLSPRSYLLGYVEKYQQLRLTGLTLVLAGWMNGWIEAWVGGGGQWTSVLECLT